ncbi:MAG: alpha/beta fold hydrolase [Alphaproteobacteria bacterium]|nr:alpha/beta fold hydrolase [Alphaproteobacteria bacterium]
MVRARPSSRIAAAARVVALAALAGLAACAPTIAPRGPVLTTPTLTDQTMLTFDGLVLGVQTWKADEPKAVIVALHGMNDYANAFAMPGDYWARRGITTYALDQRGFGRSPNRGLWAGDDVMVEDVKDLIRLVRARHPGVPTYLLGESMGGAMAIAVATSTPAPPLDGVILSAPAVWGWSELPWLYQASLWLGAHTTPWMELSANGLDIRPSDNIEMLRALGKDPYFIHDTRTDAVYGLVGLMQRANERATTLRQPTLILYGEKDEVIPKEPVEDLMDRLRSRARTVVYADGYHMLMRDLQRERVWQDIESFVRHPMTALPSGEERMQTVSLPLGAAPGY